MAKKSATYQDKMLVKDKNRVQKYNFPEQGIAVEAKSREEALNKLKSQQAGSKPQAKPVEEGATNES